MSVGSRIGTSAERRRRARAPEIEVSPGGLPTAREKPARALRDDRATSETGAAEDAPETYAADLESGPEATCFDCGRRVEPDPTFGVLRCLRCAIEAGRVEIDARRSGGRG